MFLHCSQQPTTDWLFFSFPMREMETDFTRNIFHGAKMNEIFRARLVFCFHREIFEQSSDGRTAIKPIFSLSGARFWIHVCAWEKARLRNRPQSALSKDDRRGKRRGPTETCCCYKASDRVTSGLVSERRENLLFSRYHLWLCWTTRSQNSSHRSGVIQWSKDEAKVLLHLVKPCPMLNLSLGFFSSAWAWAEHTTDGRAWDVPTLLQSPIRISPSISSFLPPSKKRSQASQMSK